MILCCMINRIALWEIAEFFVCDVLRFLGKVRSCNPSARFVFNYKFVSSWECPTGPCSDTNSRRSIIVERGAGTAQFVIVPMTTTRPSLKTLHTPHRIQSAFSDQIKTRDTVRRGLTDKQNNIINRNVSVVREFLHKFVGPSHRRRRR